MACFFNTIVKRSDCRERNGSEEGRGKKTKGREIRVASMGIGN